jgi:hypothetical protein
VFIAPVLVVDFDDTVTEGDTIGALINAAIQAQSRLEPSAQEAEERREALGALKDRLVAEYVEAFQSLVERHLPEQTHGKDTGLNMEHVSGFLDDLNDFEIRMNAKVIDSGILSGLQVSAEACSTGRVPGTTALHASDSSQRVEIASDSSQRVGYCVPQLPACWT